ncbi:MULTISPECIES: hypothetical protein [Thalassospira]|uniref:Uncharacterized protein n=1 Tax=Thalassospira aquimaris TaxID=3037796 RepID=A0ABT6GHW8_9PROT|nr:MULTISPECIES: hypothetical protein [Thalassospira]MDG4721672.1 hypothetical protein [Thalassospira sp. FZY0004]
MTSTETLTLDVITERAEREQIIAPNFKQVKLTKKFLLPKVKELETDMLRLRAEFDQSTNRMATKGSKTYPEGFCQEITIGVMAILQRELPSASTPGLMALRDFVANGGLAKRIWGNLRNQYFQNAFQFGSLYVDVSNDTVVITKPKVEILPVSKARMFPISDFDGYADIAEKYWKGQVFPNRVLPDLAVMFPMFLITTTGKVELHSNYQTILYRNLQFDFALAERFLFKSKRREDCLPESYLTKLVDRFGALENPVDDVTLRQHFEAARQSQLRFDATRCQAMLDRVIALQNN